LRQTAETFTFGVFSRLEAKMSARKKQGNLSAVRFGLQHIVMGRTSSCTKREGRVYEALQISVHFNQAYRIEKQRKTNSIGQGISLKRQFPDTVRNFTEPEGEKAYLAVRPCPEPDVSFYPTSLHVF
jgi:hypothetical protein